MLKLSRIKIQSIFIISTLMALQFCSLGKGSISSELLRPVALKISGIVTASDTAKGIENCTVKIKQVKGDTSSFFKQEGKELSVKTDASGAFSFSGVLKLPVDTYEHYLYISDSDEKYFINDSTIIFSMKDATLKFSDLKMISKNPQSTTNITGTVVDVVSDTALADVEVSLVHKTDSSISYTTSSDSDGAISIERVIVSEYSLTVDGSSLTPAYVKETSDIKLVGGAENALGNIRIAKQIDGDDLRIVLLWNKSSGLDLDIQYSFPKEDFDFNHLGVQEVDMEASDFSMNPAYKFAEGTAYWPENMGGDDSGRNNKTQEKKGEVLSNSGVTVNTTIGNTPIIPGTILVSVALSVKCTDTDNGDGTGTLSSSAGFLTGTGTINYSTGAISFILDSDPGGNDVVIDYKYTDTDFLNSIKVNNKIIVEKDRNSTDGSIPEVLTIYKENFLNVESDGYPDNLSYYYTYVKNSISNKYFPAGMGVFMVKCETCGSIGNELKSIYDSGAKVKVYQGNTYLGKFDISDLTTDPGESNRKYWSVLQIEMGYTKSNPSTTNDIYFRVVPYGSLAPNPELNLSAFVYNVPNLPRTKTYTAFFDLSNLDEVPPSNFKHLRMIGSDDGYIYSMMTSNSEEQRDYKWRPSWYGYFPDSGISHLSYDSMGMSVRAGINNLPGSAPYTGSTTESGSYNYGLWTTDFSQQGTISNGYFLPNDFSQASYPASQTFSVLDMVFYYDEDSSTETQLIASPTGVKKSYDSFLGKSSFADWKYCPSAPLFMKTLNSSVLNQSGKEVLVAESGKLWIYNSSSGTAESKAVYENLSYTGTTVNTNLAKLPVVSFTVGIEMDGTATAGDDGSGVIDNAFGTVVSAPGTINYVTGNIQFTLNSVPTSYLRVSYTYEDRWGEIVYAASHPKVGQSVSNVISINTIKSSSCTAYVSVLETSPTNKYKMLCIKDVPLKASNVNVSWNENLKVNQFFAKQMGVEKFIFYATNKGVYFSRDVYLDDTFNKYSLNKLTSYLDNVEVLKIYEVDGKLKLLTKDNGFLYVDLPEWSWDDYSAY